MSDYNLEVTLSRDLPVGPKGGVRKADSTVSLPLAEANLLLMLGDARPVNQQVPASMVPETPTGAGDGEAGTE